MVRFGETTSRRVSRAGEYYRVGTVGQKTNRVHLVAQDGREIAWRPDQRGAKTAQVFRETERRRPGRPHRMDSQRHDRELGLKNGERLEVRSRRVTPVLTRTRDGREVRLDISKESHRHFDHAYCRTIHSAQGVDGRTA